MRSPSLDQLDYVIIQALARDGRVKAAELARQLNANERTIRKRIDRLVEIGAVRLAAVVNPDFFGYISVADIFLEVDPQHEVQVMQRLAEMPEISYLAYGQGTRAVSIEARFKNNDEMREFLRRTLPSIPGVQISGYTLVPRILHNIDEWLPRPDDFLPGRESDE
jgi:DNA-binding Lrp family transcriptional regulator